MCGLSGFLQSHPSSLDMLAVAESMATALYRRGPDDCGAWHDPNAGIALSFRRLAILDLSSHGHQPMHSADGRYVLAFNGEIYNFRELRRRLEGLGHGFRSETDTEVILAASSQWGVAQAAELLEGMFAYAIWDRAGRNLHLVRDRLGIKPLYYGWSHGIFLFGSELKALRCHPDFDDVLNKEALDYYFAYGYVPTPFSIYANYHKQLPGTCLTVTAERPGEVRERAYWRAEGHCAEPYSDMQASEKELAEELDSVLLSAVRRQMVADVPMGAFLSGGIDSSAVVAMMRRVASGRVRTFSIGFAESEFDESEHALRVARHLQTEHTALTVSPREAMAVIPQLPQIYDEPFADSSQIPTYLVSQLARRQVTVSLSGDGGDELFAGYNRYRYASKVSVEPARLRTVKLLLLPAVRLAQCMARGERASESILKLRIALSARSNLELYRCICQIKSSGAHSVHPRITSAQISGLDIVSQMQLWDLLSYLPDDILTKVDRASMAVSLEARVPLLDEMLVRFASKLPLCLRIRGRTTKYLLRQVLYRYVPRHLLERPKAGFAIPLRQWLCGPLRDWAEALIDPKLLADAGYPHPDTAAQAWHSLLIGRSRNHHSVWACLMFAAWWQYGKSQPAVRAAANASI